MASEGVSACRPHGVAAIHVAGGPAVLDAAARSLGCAMGAVHALSTPQQGILFAAAAGAGACSAGGGAAARGGDAGSAAASRSSGALPAGCGAAAASGSASAGGVPTAGCGAAAANERASAGGSRGALPARDAAGSGAGASGRRRREHAGGGAGCSAGEDGVPLWRLAAAAAAIPALQVQPLAGQRRCDSLQMQLSTCSESLHIKLFIRGLIKGKYRYVVHASSCGKLHLNFQRSAE